MRTYLDDLAQHEGPEGKDVISEETREATKDKVSGWVAQTRGVQRNLGIGWGLWGAVSFLSLALFSLLVLASCFRIVCGWADRGTQMFAASQAIGAGGREAEMFRVADEWLKVRK